ncbi:MAG: hypothetical protein M1396_01925 [Chloroflexi bacterium]|nr:hypothetical protein [Chloroflexota bacterium]
MIAVDHAPDHSAQHSLDHAATANPPLWYSLYGLPVRSDIVLPIDAAPFDPGGPAAFTIRCAPIGGNASPSGSLVAWAPCPLHGADVRVYRGGAGSWIWSRLVGIVHVTPDARLVTVYNDPEASAHNTGLFMIGDVAAFVLQQLGYPTLHASAVITGGEAVCFLASSGQGKSTMLAHFLSEGGSLLADDVLPLRARANGVYAGPSLPAMKLWRKTLECTLGLTPEKSGIDSCADKSFLLVNDRFPVSESPARLRAIYILNRYDPISSGHSDVVIRQVSKRDGVVTLLQHTYNRALLLPREEAAILSLYARLVMVTPIRTLSYPSGLERMAAVCGQIQSDLGTL